MWMSIGQLGRRHTNDAVLGDLGDLGGGTNVVVLTLLFTGEDRGL